MFLRLSPLLLIATLASAAVPPGIPRDLARQRSAEIANLRYHVSFALVPHAATTAGHEELAFSLKSAEPILLDYRDGSVSRMTVNCSEVAATPGNGHLLLPADKLRAGENTVILDFTSAVAPAGKPISSYDDKDDGSQYIYTLFVPMDASMAFPCFDQPDLKGRFQLEITAPEEWTVISNTEPRSSEPAGANRQRTVFAETRPISTYLFAFAAGPFLKLERTGVLDLPGLYVRKSEWERAEKEAPEVQQIAKQGMAYLSSYFAQPFPFPKYDMVLIPGFPYGGMEHAGATFLREESVLFRAAPTHTDLLGRDLLVLHELTHQWFGDLTTMRWFDDLWLKEGFAQYMAYQTLASLKPNENIWKRFYESIKPAAYAIDVTQGTTPIYQEIPNLKDAKSAYGAIVYSKAPGVIKQLAFVIGDDKFRDGLRLYLKEHAYANAEWNDLVHAFEQTSGKPLGEWADAWIKRRGMPQVDVEWSCDQHQGGETRIILTQHDVLNEGGIWPISTQLLLDYDSRRSYMRVEWIDKETQVVHRMVVRCPSFVFANSQDYAYGRFLLDKKSRRFVVENLRSFNNVFERTLLWGSLWDSVREAEMDPREYIDLALKNLPTEQDESLAQSIIGRTLTALHRYVSAEVRA